MKRRVALIIAFLAALGTLIGVSAPSALAATGYDIINFSGRGWCIADSGEGHIEHTGNRPCRADFTFTNPATNGPHGFTYYLVRINGGSDCLDYEGYVYDEPCRVGDTHQLWAYHQTPYLISWYKQTRLIACNASNNSRLYGLPGVIFALPPGCNFHSGELQWARIRS